MNTLLINVDEVLAVPGRGNGHKFYKWISAQFDNVLILEGGTL